MKQRYIRAAVALLLVLCLCGCQPRTVQREGLALDTVCRVTLYGTDDETLLDGCFDRLAAKEKLLSRTVPGSDIARLNEANGQSVTVAQETADLLCRALAYAADSDGAFDVTVAPVSTLWDFKSAHPVPPAADAVARSLQAVGYRNLTVTGRTVQLSDPAAAVDLGGIAKGYIADVLAEYLREQKVPGALIDLGGNIVAVGSKQGEPFTVGIRDPLTEDGLAAVVRVQDRSVVTSGSYERYFDYEGVRYHHILDPQTGYPVQNGLSSVTVVAARSADADALATACFVLGAERGMALIDAQPDTEALFIGTDGTLTASKGLVYETVK